MRKSFWFWLSFVVAIVLAVYFATRITMTFLGHGPVSRIKTISVISDSGRKDLAAIANAAGLASGTRSFSVNLADINTKISSIPDIKTSATRRLPNGNLSIKVELHKPVALWTNGEVFYPLSADGTIINRPMESRPDGTVVFRGPLPADITEITKVAHAITGYLDYLEWIEKRRWNINTHDGITILLPEKDPGAAIGALMIMNKNHKILSKKIDTLDMRDTSRILVR